jgi:hypothetical protein
MPHFRRQGVLRASVANRFRSAVPEAIVGSLDSRSADNAGADQCRNPIWTHEVGWSSDANYPKKPVARLSSSG